MACCFVVSREDGTVGPCGAVPSGDRENWRPLQRCFGRVQVDAAAVAVAVARVGQEGAAAVLMVCASHSMNTINQHPASEQPRTPMGLPRPSQGALPPAADGKLATRKCVVCCKDVYVARACAPRPTRSSARG